MKLHLPKVLFAAVIAATACLSQAWGAEFTVVKGGDNFLHSATFTIDSGEADFTGGEGWKNFSNINNTRRDHTLHLTSVTHTGNDITFSVQYGHFNAGAIVVDEGAKIKELTGDGGNRTFYIGLAQSVGGQESYESVFNRDFTISPGAELILEGTQTWTISSGKTVTLKANKLTNSGNTTFSGGTVSVNKAFTNNANAVLTLNGGLRFDSGTITKQIKGGTLSNGTHGFRTGETVYTLATGSGTINLGQDFKLYMDDSNEALEASGISNQNGTLTYTAHGTSSIYEITSEHTDVVEYGNGIAATAGATGFLLEAGTKLALKTTATFNDKITATGANANIAVHEGVTLNSSNLTTTGEGSVIVDVNKGKLAINEQTPTAKFTEINLTEGATLEMNGATSRLGSETAKVAINMSGESLIYLQNGNGGSGPIWADIQTEGTNYIQGSVYGGNSVIKGTIKGSGTLGLARHNGWGNAWKIESLISDAGTGEGEQLKLKISGADIENGEMVENDGQKQEGHLQINNVTLSGANTYSGGTEIFGATVTAANASALGKGKVTMKSGTLQQSTDLTVSAMEYQGGTVTNSGKALTVTGALDAKKTMLIDGAGAVSIGSLNLADGTTLSTTGNLTLGSLTLNLNSYAVDQEHTLVSSSGTLDFKGSLADYHQQKVGDYITKVDVSDNSIVLTFEAAPESLSLEVGRASKNGDVLTLNINANLSDVSSLDLTLSAAALTDIKGLSGLVSLELIAKDGTFYTVGDSNVISKVSFYNGAYTGEGAGRYRVEYIPEPATATLSLLALAGLAARRRRK